VKLNEATSSSYGTTAKIFMATTRPLQKLIDPLEVVHGRCNETAIQILINDGLFQDGKFLAAYLEQINAGSDWSDSGWKNIAHYYNPISGRGLRGWPTAAEECSHYFQLAKNFADRQCFEKGFFYLGAAAHLVQDMCVPYHSRNIVLGSHHHYEKWAEEHVEEYLVLSGGLYNDEVRPVGEWVLLNAQASYDLYALVKDRSLQGYHKTTELMLPLAQRSTAGFFKYFLSKTTVNL
jgi:phospholipase C